MKKLLSFLVVSALILVLAACGGDGEEASGSGETITWKMGHLSNEDHQWHKTAEKFAELANEKTDGKLEIDIYPNEQLGSETEVLNGIEAGTVDMTISGETMQNWAPEAALMAVPYAFNGQEHLQKVVEGEIGKEIETSVEENVGVTPLYYHMRAPRNLTSNKPIESPEDLGGFKMRVPNVPLFMDAWEAAGARPQVMDFSEVFTGLQQGVIDGQENPVDLIQSASFPEVQDYVNVTEHVYSWIYVVVGNEQFNSLDEDMQEAVKEAAAEAQEYGLELYETETAEIEQDLKDQGMEFVEVDQEAFGEAMKPAVEESLSEEQLELYQRIVEAGQ
ncbi:sialic acid-binding periplasmic protein SiaP [Thalassobacillus devorans]|uniref:Sialic acid-binding periplasmic protein SiaP n=1 Tax=Thalassobacillus devorans TaxID=279813 RepID=A0ABQ1NTS1_9BACI|nr:TRAP transporter substrate-binding protein [Thalassobacillus devorans]NIK28651.1 tripartite ATP-independent transporter DctP family solute receptor [Thalassobacillus devorans]GGC84579.1 sialic acid-binding periplasmic protein SiaP [Thalassobacillus devorans]